MKKLRNLSKFDKLLILFTFIVFLYVYIFITNNLFHSKYKGDETEIVGIVIDKKVTDDRLTITLKAKEKILVTCDNNINLYLGDTIKVVGINSLPNENTVFNLFNYRNYLLSKKIHYVFKAEQVIKIKDNKSILYKIKNNLISYINNFKSKKYLNTFILGNNDIASEVKKSYQINGISHLFAISGMHITLFSSILLFICNRFTKKKKLSYTLISLFLLMYMFLANFSPSVVRGVLLFIFLFLNTSFNLRLSTFKILLLIVLLMLLYNPYYVYNIGFIFSFTISFYLILFGKIANSFDNYFSKLLMTSLISFLSSIPIVINNYFELNLLSPIINLFFVPIITIVIFPFSLLTLVFPIFDEILSFLINLMEYLSLFFSKISCFTIVLKKINIIYIFLYYILIIFIIIRFKNKKYYSIFYLIIVLIIHSNINILNKYPVLTMIDVGQGDSILISLPHNKGNLLVDTGGISSFYETDYSIAISKTIPYLKSIGIKKIDYLILTHGDADHMKEANNLVENFKVMNIITNSGNDNELEKQLVKKAKKINKGKIKIDNYLFEFINDKDEQNENEDSLIIYTKLNNFNILLMGDAGISSEKYITDTYNLPQMDILKVGHHGSKTSSSLIFLEKINPKISLISVGLNNKFNHPSKEVIENLNKFSSITLKTSVNGSIKLTLKKSIIIDTCLNGTLMH